MKSHVHTGRISNNEKTYIPVSLTGSLIFFSGGDKVHGMVRQGADFSPRQAWGYHRVAR